MVVYSYNPFTFEYVGFRNARLDPLETKLQGQDVFLIPANSTTYMPPEFTENQTCKFINGEWAVEDKPIIPPEELNTDPTIPERLEAAEAAILALMGV